MPQLRRLALASLLPFALGSAGCDPESDVDAGTDVLVPDSGASDAGDAPVTALTVLGTTPSDGALLVPVDVELAVVFSSAIDETVGALTLEDEAGPVALGAPNLDGASVTVTPAAPLAAGASYILRVEGFEGTDGSVMSEPVEITFTTEDREAPTVLSSIPSDDATVESTLSEIAITFSEPMRTDRGAAVIAGPGEASLGVGSWTGPTVRFAVTGLRADADYVISLVGFTDLAGNALDLASLGGDEVLGLSTGPDTIAPIVLSSQPNEGQLDLEVALLSQVELTFSEPMDPAAGTLSLVVDGGTPVPLTALWDRGDTRVRANVGGLLGAEAPHRVLVTGFTDTSGNPLDGTVHLGDGALDFTTGEDSFAPFVAFLTPEEGDTSVVAGTDQILVTFSERMPADQNTVTLLGDGRSLVLIGTWAAGNTILTIPAPMLQGGRSYTIDFTGFSDVGGTPLDAAHPYLGDGTASFTIVDPTGERCGDALTEEEGVVTGSSVTWTIPAGAFDARDGSFACDRSGASYDGVVRYRKVGADTVLHVRAEALGDDEDVDEIDIEIFAGSCRPLAPTAEAGRLRCMPERHEWDSWLEVPAGDYFVWVATDAGTTFDGATVTIEEVPAVRAGESCSAPLDATAGEGIYTAPGSPDGFHRWVIPAGYADAPDRSVYPDGAEGALSCLPEGTDLGPDVVVGFEKTSATSLVTVRVSMPASSQTDAAVEIVRGCEPGDPSTTPLTCLSYVDRALYAENTYDGAAGPLSAWVVERRSGVSTGAWTVTPETTIEIAEFEVGPGDSCATAIPITPGTTNPVTATRPHRAYVPACLTTGGVTWFRYTPTEGLGLLRTDGASLGAVVDRATGQVLRCGEDASTTMPVFGVPGEEVCIALTSSAAVDNITIDEIPYTGNRGIATGVTITKDPSVGTVTNLGTGWMAVHAGRVWRGGFGGSVGTGGFLHAPVTGGTYLQTAALPMCRYTGVARPDGIYCVSNGASTDAPRVFRVIDAVGTPLATPVPIDLPAAGTYPATEPFGGLTWDGTRFLAATTSLSMNPTSFYAIETDGTVTLLGTNNAVWRVGGLAADADYLYLSGRSGSVEGIYRLPRATLMDPAQLPVELATGNLSDDNGYLVVDDTTAAGALYYRPYAGSDVRVIVGPRGPTPAWEGVLWHTPSTNFDPSLGLDPATGALWLIHTGPPATSSGNWVRLD